MRDLVPFLRDAAVTLVPTLRDDQLERISLELDSLPNPYLLVSRISENTALIQGIPVRARSSHEADALTWQTIHGHVLDALCDPWDWDTRVTSIDVQAASGLLVS